MALKNPEFSLHVHKKTTVGRGQALYMIGIWNGPILFAICHVQPLDQALSALRNLLDQAATRKPKCWPSNKPKLSKTK